MAKRSGFLAAATGFAALGLILLVDGALHLVTAYADTTPPSIGEVDIDPRVHLSVTPVTFAGIAPGDSGAQTLTVKNDGKQDAMVSLTNVLSGALFQDNGTTGDEDGKLTLNGVTDDKSEDDSAGQRYAFDNHPLEIGYTIEVHGLNTSLAPIAEGPFTGKDSPETSPAFELKPGETATVTYTYALPLAAHNDYQGARGQMNIRVTSYWGNTACTSQCGSGNNSTSPPGGQNGTPPGGGTGAVSGGTNPETGQPIGSIAQ
jgi:hypothetical protein